MELLGKYEVLQDIVARTPGAVAFSGGADSSLLLKAAVDVFGDQALAFFADSILQSEADRVNAVDTAEQLGATLQVVDISPLQWQEFAVNPPDRCYLCKKKVYLLFKGLLPKKDMVLFDGSNLDDLQQDRPGRRAIVELGVLTPLVEAGLGKADIRRLGKYLDLPTWDRESASCLATRIPSGTRITAENLHLIACYEKVLLDLGFAGCRVRLGTDDSQSVNFEVKEIDLTLICQPEIREKLNSEFKKIGVGELWLSLRGR
ncbi:MAG: ATP-dependent sacrificial sulfur transferase LarE [Desulfobulbaceae bacterium]|nr:ATP-dependent sacrificial sulfur transferase LarE [Desulfobulbaceae bacterium]